MVYKSLFTQIPVHMLSLFIRSLTLLIIAALIPACLGKVSSSLKHIIWFSMLCGIVIIACCCTIIPFKLLCVEVQPGSSSEAIRLIDASLTSRSVGIGDIQSTEVVVASSSLMGQSGFTLSWSILCVLLWTCGSLLSFARVITGLLGIKKMRKDARATNNRMMVYMVEQLSLDFSIGRKIQVLISPACRVPFTYGVLNPVVLLPLDSELWPKDRLRAVLIHELAHVKRLDCLTQLFARMICSLFWFMPVVWIAYHHLHTEQEKSCDEFAIGTGMKAERYARHVLSIVQSVKGRVLLTGIFISRGKRNVLEKRILHLLAFRNLHLSKRSRLLSGIVVVCFLLIAQVFIFNVGLSQDWKFVPSDHEELFGAWVNASYDWSESINPAKLLYKPDGTFECFDEPDGSNKNWWGTYSITDKWRDKEGNTWYKLTFSDYMAGTTHYELARISGSGTIFESCYFNVDYPTEIDPDSLRYSYKFYTRP